jgi:pimeloyl-ACP methyl ester carboxylesterase
VGDLGGLDAGRRLIVFHPRGTGDSARPDDLESYRCDRMVEDVEALRQHLGLERLDILGHSAGANLAELYAAAHPDRVRRLVLVTPSLRAVGLAPTPEEREAALLARKDEPWFAEAYAAYQRCDEDEVAVEDEVLSEAFSYGRWDEAARAHVTADVGWPDWDAMDAHHGPGAFDPEATRAALADLGRHGVDVLVLAGELDTMTTPAWVRRLAEVFPPGSTRFEAQPGAGHYPWIDDAPAFRAVIEGWFTES